MSAIHPSMLQLDEAIASLLGSAQPLDEIEPLSTFDADGRVLAHDLVSQLQVPPMDNSSMDGYAVRCADLSNTNGVLRISQRIAAGGAARALEPESVARIFTGASIPPGADAVVMQEDCELVEGTPGGVRIKRQPKPGQWIRRAGEDVAADTVLLRKGERLSPAHIGLAASIGVDTLRVSRRPRVALFSTGNELRMPGEVLPQDMPPGSIYNSNRYFLNALLRRLGCEVTDLGIVPDQRDATMQAISGAASHHDLILSSGGVSVGEEDHVKPAVLSLGTLALWQIAIKPGKPFAYGRINNTSMTGPGASQVCHFMGLPGNPVSSFVTFLLLARPFILKLQGALNFEPVRLAMTARFDWPKADKRREFLRAKINPDGGLDLFHNQSSGVLTSVTWADGLVENPGGRAIKAGDTVEFLKFSEFM